jgi:hypothetical protein
MKKPLDDPWQEIQHKRLEMERAGIVANMIKPDAQGLQVLALLKKSSTELRTK